MPGGTGQPSSSVALIAKRYELARELRVGDDTVDWEAFDTALERVVVVQLLRPDLAHDAAAAERFWAHARSVARSTPAVGERVLDAGADPETGQAFIVREWPATPGPSARRSVPLPPREARLVSELGSRLTAHRRWLGAAGLALVLVVLGVGVKPGVERLLAWVNEPVQVAPGLGLIRDPRVPAPGGQPDRTSATPAAGSTAGPAVGRSTPTAQPVATAVPTRAATATPVASGQPRRVVNTDGRGVALRAGPGGDRLPGKGYDEGATVQAFEQSGAWTHIRGSDGREGWVLSVTLAP
jgi:hypothetical protein